MNNASWHVCDLKNIMCVNWQTTFFYVLVLSRILYMLYMKVLCCICKFHAVCVVYNILCIGLISQEIIHWIAVNPWGLHCYPLQQIHCTTFTVTSQLAAHRICGDHSFPESWIFFGMFCTSLGQSGSTDI